MAYSYKLNDTELLIGCLDYAIANFLNKESVLDMLDELINYRVVNKYDDFDDIPDTTMDFYLTYSGIDDAKLSLECDLDNVILSDALLQFGCVSSKTLLEIQSYVELLWHLFLTDLLNYLIDLLDYTHSLNEEHKTKR